MSPDNNYAECSLIIQEQLRGKIGAYSNMPVTTTGDLSIAYTPGVARPCEAFAANAALTRKLTIKHNSVAVVTRNHA